VRTYKRRVKVRYSNWSGCERVDTIFVACVLGDSEATILGRAANQWRKERGYADTLIAIDIFAQD
jgi:hypothetical protein